MPMCPICFAPLTGESTTQVFITTIGSAHTHIHTVASIDRHVQLQTQEPTCCNVCVFMCVCVSVCMCLPCSLEVEALLCGHTFHTECIGPWTSIRGPNSCIYRCQLPVADPDFMVMPPVEGESTVPHIEGDSTPVPGDDDLDTLIDVDVYALRSPEDIDREMEELLRGRSRIHTPPQVRHQARATAAAAAVEDLQMRRLEIARIPLCDGSSMPHCASNACVFWGGSSDTWLCARLCRVLELCL